MHKPLHCKETIVRFAVIAPSVISAVGIAVRPVLGGPHPSSLQRIIAPVSHLSWMFSPLFAAYTLAVAVVFLRRKDLRWTAASFLLLGLMLQQATLVAWFWVRGLMRPFDFTL
jgi:hypothetical protein